MKPLDEVGVTFVNTVVGRGILNDVVNLSLGTLLFTPSDDGKTVEPDPVISCRLRMDKSCTRQLRDVLSDLLDLIEKAELEAAQAHGNGAVAAQSDKAIN